MYVCWMHKGLKEKEPSSVNLGLKINCFGQLVYGKMISSCLMAPRGW